MKKICLVAGHGAGDPGAVANGFQEHEVAKEVLTRTLDILSGYQVDVVSILDNYNLSNKIKFINGQNFDVSIEFHLDAATPSATGMTTFFYTGSTESQKMGTQLHNSVQKGTGLKSRGVIGDKSSRHGRLAFVRDTKGFAFLVELGFITNPSDLQVIREKAGKAIADALISMYSLQKLPVDDRPFTDVPKSHMYREAAVWAKKEGISSGYPDGSLGIDEPLTVGRFLTFLQKYHNKYHS